MHYLCKSFPSVPRDRIHEASSPKPVSIIQAEISLQTSDPLVLEKIFCDLISTQVNLLFFPTEVFLGASVHLLLASQPNICEIKTRETNRQMRPKFETFPNKN